MIILIFGNKGFLGNNLYKFLNDKNLNIIGLSRDECDFRDEKRR